MSPRLPQILVVDDEPRAVEFVVRGLRRLGTPKGVESGEAAWERLQQEPFALVISDQRMPGMSGVELLSRVANSHPQVGRVLVTGYADLNDTVDAVNLGRIHAYLHKPCDLELLRTTVRGVLERLALERSNQEMRTDQARLVASEQIVAVGRTIDLLIGDLAPSLAKLRAASGDLPGESGDRIRAEVSRLQATSAEFLEMAHASRGPSECTEHDLADLLRVTVAPLLSAASHAGVELVLDAEPGARAWCDAARLRYALRNLLANALEGMLEGGRLELRACRSETGVEIRLADGGPGLPHSPDGRVFEPFATDGKPGRACLGLATARKVVEDHGGSVATVQTKLGGAGFEILLPVRP